MRNKKEILLKRVPKETLKNLGIKTNYSSHISRQTSVTYAYTTGILKKFLEEGLIKKEEGDRENYYSLTKKGKIVLENLNKIEKNL
ncbi:MAG TPA: hypothetical protein VJ912_00620 [Candidatus Nanoarchaeia archaeon]|nr:hypothetical protein [Candidatus Nanoarchaeia archaeon]